METEELTRLVDEIYKVSVQSRRSSRSAHLRAVARGIAGWFLFHGENRNQTQRNQPDSLHVACHGVVSFSRLRFTPRHGGFLFRK